MIHHTIPVDLGERSYPVYVGSDMLDRFGPTLRKHGVPTRALLVTDSTVASLYLHRTARHLAENGFALTIKSVPPGERQKSLARAMTLYSTMLEEGMGRASTVIAMGGGVIGDLAGFVAATFQRGVKLVQMPTTLLAQVDSAIGGKTAVNHPLGKNMIGSFYQPSLVWADTSVLRSLPPREVICGLGEVVKYGIIADADFFGYLEQHIDRAVSLQEDATFHIQKVCCGIKAALVAEDEQESGRRIILNFGHTVGHALEAAGGYRMLKHGEAVLLGIVAETFIAREIGLIGEEVQRRVVDLIRRIPIRSSYRSWNAPDVLAAMAHDKKNIGTVKRFVLPTKIGEVTVVDTITTPLIRDSLKYTLKAMR